MAVNRFVELCDAEAGTQAVLQGNLAFAVGCVRGGLHGADGYPGTPSTEVIDKGLYHVQDRMVVGWSVNEATAVNVGLGFSMAGGDIVVTMKIPGLFQAADAVATMANFTAPRGGFVLYVASDFVPSSTQYVWDPRYFLKSCFIPILEPRTHQQLVELAPLAAQLSRRYATPVAVLVNGLLCHSEGLVALPTRQQVPRLPANHDYKRFMNLPEIARRNYQQVVSARLPGVRAYAETSPLNAIEWHDRRLGVIVHGMTERYLREAWPQLPVKPSLLALGTTWPLPLDLVRQFVAGISGRVVALGDGLRFLQEELAGNGIAVDGKQVADALTEWTPEEVAQRLGAQPVSAAAAATAAPIKRPATICAGCPYRAFGLVVKKLRKKKKIVASFGDIGCNTLLYFLDAIDTCACMGASDATRQGAVLCDPSLGPCTISVIGDSTECHSGLDATRNAVFRNSPGVQVVLDNRTTAMTGGQPAPSSPANLAGSANKLDLVAALRAEGASVQLVDAFDMDAIEKALRAALEAAAQGTFTSLVIRGECIQELPEKAKRPLFAIDYEKCKKCDLCLVCPGLEVDGEGFPRFTHLCNGCGGSAAICVQRCNLDAIVPLTEQPKATPPPPVAATVDRQVTARVDGMPAALRIAVRGVGGQGNLFLGKVLSEVALRTGFGNVVKGETHGMAQLGGAVMSTFACGDVYSPVLAPGTVDALVALECSEVLRPGFLDLLKPGGTVALNTLRILPSGFDAADYPSLETVRAALGGHQLVEFDALAAAQAIGDSAGRTVNVVALGVLSTLQPLDKIPLAVWHAALAACSGSEILLRANLAAFEQGRRLCDSTV